MMTAHRNLSWGSLAAPIQWLAGGSFTLYLVHVPLMLITKAIVGFTHADTLFGLITLLGVMIVAYGLAELGERRKHVFKVWVEAGLQLATQRLARTNLSPR